MRVLAAGLHINSHKQTYVKLQPLPSTLAPFPCLIASPLLAPPFFNCRPNLFSHSTPTPQALASNLAFVERYRYAAHLGGEAAYFFVQMVGRRGGLGGLGGG